MEALGSAGKKFDAMARVGLITEHEVKLYSEAGGVGLYFGVESLDVGVQALMGKRSGLRQFIHDSGLCRHYGVGVAACVMLGLPGSTERSDREMIEGMKKLIDLGVVDFAEYGIFVPIPGTRSASCEQLRIVESDYWLWDTDHVVAEVFHPETGKWYEADRIRDVHEQIKLLGGSFTNERTI